jgi:IS4 transposase
LFENFRRLPQFRVTVAQKGFRTTHFYIATTLLDAELYLADDIADLYLQRWHVKLSFRDIKTTMGIDILRCKTPDMVRKEIVMHMIVYNGIRQLMFESAQRFGAELRRVSFKGSDQAMGATFKSSSIRLHGTASIVE